jgi:hypothetical protein
LPRKFTLRSEACDAAPLRVHARPAFGRIDGAHRTGGAARDQNLGKGAVAAPDVYPAEAIRHSEPIKECFTDDAAPTAHPPFVGFAISEKIFDFAHVKFLCAAGTIVRSTSTSCIKLLQRFPVMLNRLSLPGLTRQ